MQLAFSYNNKTIPFEVIYRKRKTIGITVEPPDRVTVFVSPRLKPDTIIDRVASKGNWIVNKLEEFKDVPAVPVKKEFSNGELFMYLGKEYPLQLAISPELSKPVIELEVDKLQIISPILEEEFLRAHLEKWYRKRAGEEFNKRVAFYQPIINCQPQKITIKAQKKRWGSCSSKGNLNFNWRVIMAPEMVVDYLVVHEMCHLVHLNHSRDFWHLVATIIPDYKERRNWLKKNGYKLNW